MMLCWFILGVLFGAFLTVIIARIVVIHHNDGILVIDDSTPDDEPQRWQFDMHTDQDEIQRKSWLRFRVCVIRKK